MSKYCCMYVDVSDAAGAKKIARIVGDRTLTASVRKATALIEISTAKLVNSLGISKKSG